MADPVTAHTAEAGSRGAGAEPKKKSKGPPSKLARLFDYLSWGVLILVGFHLLTRETGGPDLDSEAPAHTLIRVKDGAAVQTPASDHKGPILIKAFASWCSACKRSVWIEELTDLDSTGDLEFVAVSVDEDIENAREAARTWPIAGEVLFDKDGNFSRDYDIQVLPTYILLDENHRVSRVTSGLPGPLDIRSWKHAAKKR